MKIFYFSIFVFVFSFNFSALFAGEKYSEDFMRNVPTQELNDNFQHKYDDQGDLYVLDVSKKEVRIYNTENILVKSINWSSKLEGKEVSSDYFLDVDNLGDFIVVSNYKGPCLFYDEKGVFVQKIYLPTSSVFNQFMRFYDGIIYSDYTGEIYFKKSSESKLRQPFFLKDIKRTKDSNYPPGETIENQLNGRSIVLPKISGYFPASIDWIDFEGNIYVNYSIYSIPFNPKLYGYKTLKLDKDFNVVSIFDGRLRPGKNSLNQFYESNGKVFQDKLTK